MDVSAIMTPRPITVAPEIGLDQALQLMADEDVRHLPVVEDGRLVGVLSERDLLSAVGWVPRPVDKPKRSAIEEMHTDVSTVMPADTLVTACVSFQVDRIGCLPVVDDDDELVGIITETDVLASYHRACKQGYLGAAADPPARDHMSTRMTTVPASTDLRDAIAHAGLVHGRHFPVVHDDRLVGIVSDRDLRAARGEGRRDDTPIAEIMSADVITLGPDETLSRAAELMADQKLGALPVVDDGRLVGILTLTDLVEHCLGSLREHEGRG